MHRVWTLVAALMLSGCIPGVAPSTLPVGEVAPDFAVEVRGQTASLKELRGGVVLLNFWSSG